MRYVPFSRNDGEDMQSIAFDCLIRFDDKIQILGQMSGWGLADYHQYDHEISALPACRHRLNLVGYLSFSVVDAPIELSFRCNSSGQDAPSSS